MNQSKYWFPSMRCGKRINDGQAINALVCWAHKEGKEIYVGLLGMHTHGLTRNTLVSGLFIRFRNF